MLTLIIKYFDFAIPLLKRFDRFLARAAAVDPEKCAPISAIGYIPSFYITSTTSFVGCLVLMPTRLRRRIHWQQRCRHSLRSQKFFIQKISLRR